MTQAELDQKINDISTAYNVSAEEKTRRINNLKAIYSSYQTRTAAEAKSRQQAAESALKGSLKTSYMANPAATNEDFERDYPQLKSDYLRGEAMNKDAAARESMRRAMQNSF